MPNLIENYLVELRRELFFDRALAQRVCIEVRDHLIDLVESEGGGEAAERQALLRIGHARSMAADMASATLPARVQRAWRLLLLCAPAVFVAMRLRNTLLPIHEMHLAGTRIALALDRFAYRIALLVGASAWMLARWKGHWRAIAPVWLCAMGLAISTAAGIGLLILATDGWRATVVLPALSAVLAMAVLGLAFDNLRSMGHQARLAAGVRPSLDEKAMAKD